MRTRARRPMAEWVMGSISEDVVRTSRHPVLMIGPRCAPPPERFTSMVVALDGSALAEQILPTVEAWASQTDMTPWLFQVLSPRVPLEAGVEEDLDANYVHNIATHLADQDIKANWDTAHDRDPAAAIVRFADQHAPGIIALTTHGHSGLGRVALGSVAFDIAHRATCPVLVLRPDDPAAR